MQTETIEFPEVKPIEVIDGKTYINGRYYPMWSQFVEKKSEWIGGELIDSGDNFDRSVLKANKLVTKIIDITLEPNGTESAKFSIVGEDFTCGFGTNYGGVTANNPGFNGITFSGYGGHRFTISKP